MAAIPAAATGKARHCVDHSNRVGELQFGRSTAVFLSKLQANAPTPYPGSRAGAGPEHLSQMGKKTVVAKQSTNRAS